jgi:hypothetical protein
MKFEFPNIANIFETPNLIFDTVNQKLQTFMTIYLDGNEFWWGIVDYDTIEKNDQYYDSGWKYRSIGFTAYDRLAYFWWNSVPIIEPLFYADDYIYEFMDRIFAKISIISTATEYDTELGILEENGNAYAFTVQRLISVGDCVEVRDFLKEFMLGFAAYIYNFDGKYRVIKRTGGSETSISFNDLVDKASKYQSNKIIEYIKLSGIKNWTAYCSFTNFTHEKEYGNTSAITSRKFLHTDTKNLLMAVFVTNGESGNYPTPADYSVIYDSWGTMDNDGWYFRDNDKDFLVNKIESGMVIFYEGVGFYSAPVLIAPARNQVKFAKVTGQDPLDSGGYYVDKRPEETTPYELFKIHTIILNSAAAYNEWFLTSNEILKLTLKSFNTYRNLHNRFIFDSNSHRLAKCYLDFLKGTMEFHLRQVKPNQINRNDTIRISEYVNVVRV